MISMATATVKAVDDIMTMAVCSATGRSEACTARWQIDVPLMLNGPGFKYRQKPLEGITPDE